MELLYVVAINDNKNDDDDDDDNLNIDSRESGATFLPHTVTSSWNCADNLNYTREISFIEVNWFAWHGKCLK